METSLLLKLITGKPITNEEIAYELYEVCDREHAHCNDACPVYAMNGNKVLNDIDKDGCDCFKNGTAMLNFIKTASLIDILINDEEYLRESKLSNMSMPDRFAFVKKSFSLEDIEQMVNEIRPNKDEKR